MHPKCPQHPPGPIIHATFPPTPQTSIDEEDISNQVCIHSQPTELLKPYIQNLPYDDLLRNFGGLTIGMILWLSNFIYGGLHAAAWNEHFPTTAEKWLWRVSCNYLSFAGGLWIILNWAAAAYPPLNEFWERWRHGMNVVIPNPSVGESLQDHGLTPFCWEVAENQVSGGIIRYPEVAAAAMQAYHTNRSGPLSQVSFVSSFLPIDDLTGTEHTELLDMHLSNTYMETLAQTAQYT